MPNQRVLTCVYLFLLGVLSSGARAAAVTDVCIGEPVELAGMSWTAIDSTSGDVIPDLGDIAFANYVILEDAGQSFAATLTSLATAGEDASRSNSMRFFFRRAGSYSVTAKDIDGHQVRTDYRVSVPTVEITRRALSDVNHYVWVDTPILELGSQDTAGLDLDFTISMGSCSGTISDVQTLSFTDIDGFKNGSIQIYDTAGEFVLDFDPEFYDTWQFDFSLQKSAGDQFSLSYEDSPKTPLWEDMLCTSTHSEFRYYLLFKPD